MVLDLNDKDTASLQCIARETVGKLLSTKNADELSDAIGPIVVAQYQNPNLSQNQNLYLLKEN